MDTDFKVTSYKESHTKFEKAFRAWRGFMNACYKRTDKYFPVRGEQGIDAIAKWHDFDVFINEVGWPMGTGNKYRLTRKDKTQGYYPGNVKWSDNS